MRNLRPRQLDVLRPEERNPAETRPASELAPVQRDAGRVAGPPSLFLQRLLVLRLLPQGLRARSSFAAGTVPTRSRAMAFTSLVTSNVFFLRAKHPPHGVRTSISAVNGFCRNITRPGAAASNSGHDPQDNRSRRSRRSTGWPPSIRSASSSIRHAASWWHPAPRTRKLARRRLHRRPRPFAAARPRHASYPMRFRYRPIIFRSGGSSSTIRIFADSGTA